VAKELVALLFERGADPFDTQVLYNTSITRDDTTWLDFLWTESERRGVLEHWTSLHPALGGPMGVYESDRHPHLTDELRLIEATVADGRPVIGTCLGSQLLAAALGARVYPNTRKEIGWHDVELTDAARDDALLGGAPRRFTPVHWHGDIFDLPAGAVHLAGSAITPHQAYRYGANTYGLLFHLELDRAHLDTWMTAFAAELAEVGIAPGEITGDADRRLAASAAIGTGVFDRFAALIG